mmetsp:Transcript_9115/g.22911  ORF Transcript_9115/g.22911 Transcript_9115/m.22911 type:complete len:248 (-) Transcript_9115:2165-2908(-)
MNAPGSVCNLTQVVAMDELRAGGMNDSVVATGTGGDSDSAALSAGLEHNLATNRCMDCRVWFLSSSCAVRASNCVFSCWFSSVNLARACSLSTRFPSLDVSPAISSAAAARVVAALRSSSGCLFCLPPCALLLSSVAVSDPAASAALASGSGSRVESFGVLPGSLSFLESDFVRPGDLALALDASEAATFLATASPLLRLEEVFVAVTALADAAILGACAGAALCSASCSACNTSIVDGSCHGSNSQ